MTMNRARRQLLAGMTSGALGSLGSLGSLGRLGSLGTLGTVGTLGTLGGCASGVPLQSVAGRRILIIGAGFAGLSAANALQASGAEVIVLEARERAGGRVLTDRSLGFPLDLGPSWLHGGAGNPLKAIAASAGVATQVTDYSNLRFTSSVSGGRQVMATPQVLGYAGRIHTSMNSPWMWMRLRWRALLSSGDLSAADVFDEAIRDAERRAGPIDRGMVALQRWVLESTLAAPLNEVSASALLDTSGTGDDGDVLPTDDRYLVAGMDSLVTMMARGIDIRYGEKISAIDWKPGSVRVTTAGGEWAGDCAVVTLPVGVLRNGDVQFTPALPASFTASLGRLRMGLFNKVCLSFPEAFWDTKLDFLTYYSDPAPLCYAWLNLTRYNGAPALVGFTSGSAARQLESMTDDAIVANVMQRIRTRGGSAVAGSRSVPDPVQVRISRWAADPLARGSYSFLGLGGSGSDRDRLAVPVGNTLFFAGEATHRTDPASVHGAWWSGQRAAAQIRALA